jgi:hypothetical protein
MKPDNSKERTGLRFILLYTIITIIALVVIKIILGGE